MDKIFELLGIDKIDESKQDDLKKALQTVVETKASEMADSKVEKMLEEKEETLKEEYKEKFDEYKEDITTKFSNFVDSVLDEEMVIPENIKKFAHLGETYEELIEAFKTRLAIDEGMIDDDVKSMLREAKDEIEGLRESLDEAKGKTLDLETDTAKMAAHIYVRQKCDGLTEAQKKQVINLLEGIIVKEDIDRKFDIILESLKITIDEDAVDTTGDGKSNGDDGSGEQVAEMECPECGNKETIKEGGDTACPECGSTMKAVKEDDGKGKAEVEDEDDEKKKMDESRKSEEDDNATPFEAMRDVWVNMIKDDK